jgi:hypothetical protein
MRDSGFCSLDEADVADPRGGMRGVIPERQHYPTGG